MSISGAWAAFLSHAILSFVIMSGHLSSGLPTAVCALCHLGWAGGSDPLQAVIYGACTLSSLQGLAEPHTCN